MARKTMQKQYITTVVKGTILQDGKTKRITVELNGRMSLDRAQRFIRRNQDSSFNAISCKYVIEEYRMTFEDFRKHALRVSIREEA